MSTSNARRLKTTVIRPIVFLFMVSNFLVSIAKLSANVFGFFCSFKFVFIDRFWFFNEEKCKRSSFKKCTNYKTLLCWFCVIKITKPTNFQYKAFACSEAKFFFQIPFFIFGKSYFSFGIKGKFIAFDLSSWNCWFQFCVIYF